jgi:signal transduction histidine kinase
MPKNLSKFTKYYVPVLLLISSGVLGQDAQIEFNKKLEKFEFNSISKLDSAFQDFQKKGFDDGSRWAAEANYIFGKRYFSKSVLDKSMALLLKAKKLLEKHKMNRELADTYHFLGLNASKTNQKQKAVVYYTSCNNLAIAIKDTFNMINGLHGMGKMFEKDSAFDKAEQNFTKALALGLKSKDSLSVSYSYDFLSQLMGRTNRPQYALKNQLSAMKIREQLGDKYALAISINNVGECYRLLNEESEAERYFLQALALTKTIGFRDLESYIYSILIDFAKKKNNLKLALEYSERQKEITDSIFSENMTKSLAEVQGKYDLAEKERILVEKELAYQNQKFLSLLGFLTLVLVSGVAFYFYKRKQEQKKILEAKALVNIEKERIRIARDLHDNLGPELTQVISKLDLLSYKQNETQEGNLAQLANHTRQAMEQLRDTIWSIRGEVITLGDFAAKIREYAKKRFKDYGVEFLDICSNDAVSLGPIQALNLFRVCQEAINNAVKYSNSSKVILDMKCDAEIVYIGLKDNGLGFNIDSIKNGYGLRNMQERIAEIGGEITIDSNESGTHIQISVPLQFIVQE